MTEWIKGFLSAKNDLSSKRLVMILSYIVALGLCITCVCFHIPLENNVLTALMGCCGVSSGTYAFSHKTETKKDSE